MAVRPVDRLVVDVALDVDLGVVAVARAGASSPRGRRTGRAACRPGGRPPRRRPPGSGSRPAARRSPRPSTWGRTSTTASNSTSPSSSPGGDLDLGRRDHVDVLGLDRLDVVLGQRVAQGLLACRPRCPRRASSSLPGRLAGPESGDAHFPGELAERGVDRALEIGGGDRDVQLDLVAFERLDRRRDGHGAGHSIAPATRSFAPEAGYPPRGRSLAGEQLAALVAAVRTRRSGRWAPAARRGGSWDGSYAVTVRVCVFA